MSKMDDKDFKYQKSGFETPYNVAYINFSLLDELDYVIGGYGKPKPEFILSLNSFIESYVLNETFHFSFLEWSHYTNTNKTLFTKGRPIYNILFKKGEKILFRDWLGPFFGYCTYCQPVDNSSKETQYHIDKFQKNVTEEIKKKYFRPALFLGADEKFPYLYRNFAFNEPPKQPNYLIIAIERSQKELLQGLYDGNFNINCNATVPFSGLKALLNFNDSLLPSNQSFKILSEIHNQKIQKLKDYTGYRKVFIPPLVSILLSKCKSMEDIPTKLRGLRDDFTELRASFTTLEKNIDTADNLKEQFEAVDNLYAFWQAFNRKYKSGNSRLIHHIWDIKKASDVEKAAEKVLDSGDVEGFLSNLNAVSAVSKLTSNVISYFKDKKSLNRFNGMTNLWELFQKTPTLENQAKDYERIFNVKIDLKELAKLYENTRTRN